MRDDSPIRQGGVMFGAILLLFVVASDANPIDYEDVNDLLPTEPQTTNDTLAAIVRDPVVQDAVQNTVGNGSLEGLVVKKKVFIMPATEPTKVVSQREQVLVVPMTHLEDVRKNITETVNADTDADGTTLADVTSFTEDSEDGYEDEHNSSYASRRDDLYEALTEISETTPRWEPIFDNAPREIAYLLPNPSPGGTELPAEQPSSPVISVPIIAFLDPARISDDKIAVPIAAALPKRRDDTTQSQLNLLEEGRDEIQRNVQSYVDGNSWRMDPDKRRLTSSPSSEIQASLSPYEPATIRTHYANNVRSENSFPLMPRIDIVTPLFWTSDADANYPAKDPRDMDVAADIVFRPLFRFRQEAQQRRRGADNEYRRPAYRRYNAYPRRNYGYRPRYSDDYYY